MKESNEGVGMVRGGDVWLGVRLTFFLLIQFGTNGLKIK